MRRALLVTAALLAVAFAEPAEAQQRTPRRSLLGSRDGSQGIFKRPRLRLFGNLFGGRRRSSGSYYRPRGGGGG